MATGRRITKMIVDNLPPATVVWDGDDPQIPDAPIAAMQDDFDSYVVCPVGSGDPEPFAHFLAESDAAGYARKLINTHGVERAYVFGVATTATGAAFTRVARGEAELVETVAGGQLQAQLGADSNRAWEQARKAGSEAIRKFLGR